MSAYGNSGRQRVKFNYKLFIMNYGRFIYFAFYSTHFMTAFKLHSYKLSTSDVFVLRRERCKNVGTKWCRCQVFCP